MAKNFNTSTGEGAFKGFTIQPLKSYIGEDMTEDLVNCPVRALKTYLRKTKHVRDSYNQLLLSCNKFGVFYKPAGKNAISSWIKHVIADSHKSLDDNTTYSLARPAHEIRAIASSLCLYKNVAVESILEQCRWKNQSTFTSFYLRDVATTSDNALRMGPLMAAGTVIAPVRRQPSQL